MAAEVLARISEMIQAADSAQLEEMAAPKDLIATNGLPQANGPAPSGRSPRTGSGRSDSTNRFQSSSRSQNDDRRSRSRRSSRSRVRPAQRFQFGQATTAGPATALQANAPAGDNGGPARLDYSAFKVIVDRNIFDPNRYPRRAGEPRVRPTPRTVDSLTLVGTMSYEKGSFAFFDGTSSEYKKALKLTDVIAGYKVTNIAPNSVKLAAGTNELELRVGMQLRREEDGPWLLAGQSGSYAATPASTSTNTAAAATATATDHHGLGCRLWRRGERHNQETDATTRTGINANENDQSLPSDSLPVHRHPNPGRGTDARRSHQRTAQRAGHDHPSEHRSTAARANPGAGDRHQRGRRTAPPVPDVATNALQAPTQPPATNAAAPPVVVENSTDGLRLNFHDAPLSLVLDYLSDAAGFIINKETDVRGTVEVWSKEP